MNTTQRILLDNAHHEAGHAVVGLALGAVVKRVAIGLEGQTDFDFKPIPKDEHASLMAIIIAGLVANLLQGGDEDRVMRAVVGSQRDIGILFGRSPSDTDQGLTADQVLTTELIKRWVLDDVVEHGFSDTTVAAWDKTLQHFSTQDLLDTILYIKTILRDLADVHAALVSALVEKGWLSGEEVMSIWEGGL